MRAAKKRLIVNKRLTVFDIDETLGVNVYGEEKVIEEELPGRSFDQGKLARQPVYAQMLPVVHDALANKSGTVLFLTGRSTHNYDTTRTWLQTAFYTVNPILICRPLDIVSGRIGYWKANTIINQIRLSQYEEIVIYDDDDAWAVTLSESLLGLIKKEKKMEFQPPRIRFVVMKAGYILKEWLV